MGGRGSWSRTHGGVRESGGGGGQLYVSKRRDMRKDIRQLFVNELGFKDVVGTGDIPVAQLGALGIQLKKLEKQYGVLANGNVILSATSKRGVKGAAAVAADGSMVLFVNPSAHSSVKGYRETLKGEQKSGFKTATDGKITNDFSYTARHEYGHLLQFQTTRNNGKSAGTIRNEVQSIAKRKYGAKSNNPSRYGAKNEHEYFAESFASMTGGKPNAHGKALSDWLKKRKK